MILRDRIDLYEVIGVTKVLDEDTLEYVYIEERREFGTGIPAYVGRADGMVQPVPMGGSLTVWLADDEAVVITGPIPDVPVDTPTKLRVRHHGRLWSGRAVRKIMRGDHLHHLSIRVGTPAQTTP